MKLVARYCNHAVAIMMKFRTWQCFVNPIASISRSDSSISSFKFIVKAHIYAAPCGL